MNILNDVYQGSLSENEKNLRFVEDHLQKLKSLDFNNYSDKLKVPILVPVGSRILFHGELKHTNEVTVALGANYFTKCTLAQAEILRQHRIKKAETLIEHYKKERDHLENHVLFSKENVFQNVGQEIIETHTEEEDQHWREKHRENIRKWKQIEKIAREVVQADEIKDEELWNRLEELELQEELENELLKDDNNAEKENSFVVKEESLYKSNGNKDITEEENENEHGCTLNKSENKVILTKPECEEIHNEQRWATSDKSENKVIFTKPESVENQNEPTWATSDKSENKVIFTKPECEEYHNEQRWATSDKSENKVILTKPESVKFEVLQKIIDKQEEIEEKLAELRNKERPRTKTELDLIAKLDEMEELDDLQDQMDRLEHIIDMADVYSDEESTYSSEGADLKRRVSFADEDDSETLELVVKHSKVEPNKQPYDPKKGIAKPSDIYEAYSHLFAVETASILKKSKYKHKNINNDDIHVLKVEKKKAVVWPDLKEETKTKTIIVKDVVERANANEMPNTKEKRHMSLFKQKRLQKKS